MLRLLKDKTALQYPDVQEEAREVTTPVVLTPTRVLEMMRARDEYQVVKFRSTCSDCVPNL